MTKNRNMKAIKFIARDIGELYKKNNSSDFIAIDVSSYAEFPFCKLSPYTYSNEFKIPVPGTKNKFSQSVEGIWQGLKVINNTTDESLFERRPHKRKGNVQGHLYEDHLLDITQARKRIYFPAYFFYLENYVPKETIDKILNQAIKKQTFVYDVESNGDINSPQPLAHSAVLATYLNLKMMNIRINPSTECERIVFEIFDSNLDYNEKRKSLVGLNLNPEITFAIEKRGRHYPLSSDDYFLSKLLSGRK